MALPSFFKLKRKVPEPARSVAPDPSAEDVGAVQLARTRARRRLIGAVVLLAAGVIGFPMVFETQPRPLPGNIPIELPRREAQTPQPVVAPRNAATVTDLPPVAEASPAAPASEAAAGPDPASVAASAPLAQASAVARPASRALAPPAAPPVATRAASSPPAAVAGTATAPGEVADSKLGRFVVQVGAYTDANALREVRIKVEKLGLKTYTQSIETEAGKRTRVRVGPFATRQEADGASSKLKAAGLPGNVLVL